MFSVVFWQIGVTLQMHEDKFGYHCEFSAGFGLMAGGVRESGDWGFSAILREAGTDLP